MELGVAVSDIATSSATGGEIAHCFSRFQSGAGPYGGPQLVKRIAAYLSVLVSAFEAIARCVVDVKLGRDLA
jgi:hypothetical protein